MLTKILVATIFRLKKASSKGTLPSAIVDQATMKAMMGLMSAPAAYRKAKTG